ncbi:MAG: hypothetical protein AWM53_00270 [Candidatus Dichloromethanomonas elyunquensis]|nr:MAG: hypothetical protein AWM53_00270 [Candidatus Dichloromethanomonas elyunquensis]
MYGACGAAAYPGTFGGYAGGGFGAGVGIIAIAVLILIALGVIF